MKKLKSEQIKYDNMNDDDRFEDGLCQWCGRIAKQCGDWVYCPDTEFCGWEQDDE